MATWTTLPDASLEPGKPIRSIDGLALRDNPVAIAEGASGAPQVQTNALITSERMTTSNVLSATAGASAGAVGTYSFLRPANATTYTPNQTLAASNLRFSHAMTQDANTSGQFIVTGDDGGTPSGTWRLMAQRTNEVRASLWLRIS